MKKNLKVLPYFIYIVAILIFQYSCKKAEKNSPTVNNPIVGKTHAIFNPIVNYGTLTDIEGNNYKTVKIGTQIWMAENLRTTKYNDGTLIPIITDNSEWFNLKTGGCCSYNNWTFPDSIATFGRLYNYYAINSNKLCPQGWHIPKDEDWAQLINYLGDGTNAGGKLKETGTTHWASPNNEAINSTGFTGLPGGGRYFEGKFYHFGNSGCFWSGTKYSGMSGYCWLLESGVGALSNSNQLMEVGLSIRCIKD
jgi:uncharacterized protein (TIGR02145 family)